MLDKIDLVPWLQSWGPTIGGTGAITAFFGWLAGRRQSDASARKAEAEARRTEVEANQAPEEALHRRTMEALQKLITAQDHRISELVAAVDAMGADQRTQSGKLDRLQRSVTDLTAHITRLEAILERHGLPIPPRPDALDE